MRSIGRGCTVVVVCGLLAISAVASDNQKTRDRAQKALRSGDYEQAEQLYRQLLAKDEHDNDARLGLSQSLLKQRRLQDSFDYAARVLAVDPLSARAHALLGSAVLASGDFRLSIEEFRTALSLNDSEAMAVAGLAMVDFYENRMSNCLAGLRRAVSLDSNEADYLFNLGQAAARSEKYKEAADAYERFLIVAPRTDADRRARIRGLIEFLRYLGNQSSLYVAGGADRTVVPFELPDRRPIVKVRINGSRELRFVLDTGSGMSVISEETARKLGIRPIARGGLARAVGGGGRFEIVYGYLNSLEVGDVKIENVPVYIRHFFDETNPVDGYLGIAAISRLIAVIDYDAKQFALIRARNNQPPDLGALGLGVIPTHAGATTPYGINVPLRTTSSGFLSGEVSISGLDKPLNFIVDTGATVTVVSEKTAALEEAQGFIQSARMKVFGAAGIAEDVKTVRLPKVVFGGLTRERLDAAVLDLDPVNETAGFMQNGILGANFLSHFRLIFDFQRGVLRLEPADRQTATDGPLPPREPSQ
jgi:predicted aspartyl protease/cytochrome c-type biogenesis protein CcmH/NrfG